MTKPLKLPAPQPLDAADFRWTVRGVPISVRHAALRAAGRTGQTQGEWLTGAILKSLPPELEIGDRVRLGDFSHGVIKGRHEGWAWVLVDGAGVSTHHITTLERIP